MPEKKQRKKMSELDYFMKQPYMSILNLLFECKELEAKHFRYILIKNHDNLHEWTQKTMAKFFEKHSQFLNSDVVKKECITDRKNLNKFLKRLLKVNYIYKQKVGKKNKYKASQHTINEIIRINNKMNIDCYPKEFITELGIEHSTGGPEKNYPSELVSVVLYGLPQKFFDSLSSSEVKKFLDIFMEIEINIRKIEDMTYFKNKNRKDFRPLFPIIGFSRFPKIIEYVVIES